ncbi:hypothetical protein AB8850_00575, partial [Streptomyces griseorubens]
GESVVLVFTSPAHAFMSPTLRHDTLPVRDLIRSLAHPSAISLLVNAGAVAPLVVPANRVPVDRGEDPAGSSPHTSGRYP